MNARMSSMVLIAMLAISIGCEAKEAPAIPSAESPEHRFQTEKEKPKASAEEKAEGARYKVNPAKSHVTAQVGVGGMLKGFGHPHLIAIGEIQGEVETPQGLTGPATIRLRFGTGSAEETSQEFDEKDRQKVNAAVRQDALESARFPEAAFKSRKVEVKPSGEHQYLASITGDFTLHGVTKEVSFPARVTLQGKSLHAEGSFTILHSAYGIKRLSAVGGTIKAKDEISIVFDLLSDPE